MLQVAASQVGVREGRDPDGNWNNIQKYGTWYAAQVHDQAFAACPWCDIFVSWCAAHSGNGDIIPLSAWVPGRLSYYRAKKLSGHYPPAPGDLGIVMENGEAVHVFIVESYSGTADHGTVTTLEGNTNDTGAYQGNGVYRLQRDDYFTNARYIYCRPAYATAPVDDAPPMAPVSDPIPNPKPAPVVRVQHGGKYVVIKGDTLSAIADSFNVSVADLVSWNHLKDANTITVGEVLQVVKPVPALPTIPAPPRYNFHTAILLNDENLRLGKYSATATYYNPRLWSWLYWEGGTAGRNYCRAHYAAWMKESSHEFGPQALAATQEAYALLHASNKTAWPADQTIDPKPTWPGPALLEVLGCRAD
jgi:LysM repeat protein